MRANLGRPCPRLSKSYTLTGPELKDMHGFEQDSGAVLGRDVTYIPEDVDARNNALIDPASADLPHVAEHLKILTKLVAGGRYGVFTGQLEILIGRVPKTVRWALENNPRLRQVAGV